MGFKKIALFILAGSLFGAAEAGADGRHHRHGWEQHHGDRGSEYERPRRHRHEVRPSYTRHEYRRYEYYDRSERHYREPEPAVERVVVCRETVQGGRNTAPIFIGSMVGGLVGHQMSHGDEGATAVATVVGTLVGYEISRESRTSTMTTWQPCR